MVYKHSFVPTRGSQSENIGNHLQSKTTKSAPCDFVVFSFLPVFTQALRFAGCPRAASVLSKLFPPPPSCIRLVWAFSAYPQAAYQLLLLPRPGRSAGLRIFSPPLRQPLPVAPLQKYAEKHDAIFGSLDSLCLNFRLHIVRRGPVWAMWVGCRHNKKAFTWRLILDFRKLRNFSVTVRNEATVDVFVDMYILHAS